MNKPCISLDADAAFYDATEALINKDIPQAMHNLFYVAYESGLLDWCAVDQDENGSYWLGFKMPPGSRAEAIITDHRVSQVYG